MQQAIKCVTVGDEGVGRKTLLMKFEEMFSPALTSPPTDHYLANIKVGGKPVDLELYYTPSQDHYSMLRTLYYPGKDIVFICFSLIDRPTFENAKTKWLAEVSEQCPNTPVILIGTKLDLRKDQETLTNPPQEMIRPITCAEGLDAANEIGAIEYFECSGLSGEGLKDVIDELGLIWTDISAKKGSRPEERPS